jgi:hypothetical protein
MGSGLESPELAAGEKKGNSDRIVIADTVFKIILALDFFKCIKIRF